MLHIPNELWVKYGTILNKKAVPVSFHNHYEKWQRYYNIKEYKLWTSLILLMKSYLNSKKQGY